jgi:peptide/nickel transport system substrate-binding protein
VTACATPARPPEAAGPQPPQSGAEAPRRGGTITVAVRGTVPTMAPMGTATTTTGGWAGSAEIHSAALITSDYHSRTPIDRLAERVPSLDEGTVALLPDGRMRVTYPLRTGITWHDGTPFTAQDLVFSHRFLSDAGIPNFQLDSIPLMESVEAPNDTTFVIYFKGPYNRFNQLGLRAFWPYPQHILGPAYERYLATRNAEEVTNLRYWTSEYVHLGPFRLTSFDPGDAIVLQAYDGYFLGRPRADTVRVRVFGDGNTLTANLLVGAIDLVVESTLEPEIAIELEERWKASGEGTVVRRRSSLRHLTPQWRPAVQTQPANFDVRVRAALYHALDRATLAEALRGDRDLIAWEMMVEGELLHDAAKDGLRRYVYDPARALALLRDVGWSPGPDGMLRNASDGRPFSNSITGTSGATSRETAAMVDYWRRIGVDAEQHTIPDALVRNAETRATYPAWENSSTGPGDQLLDRLQGPAATAENRWSGNRGGYEDPQAQRLLQTYSTSLTFPEQFAAMKAISDFVTETLPFSIIFVTTLDVAVRKGVKALDDHQGGDGATRPYGTYSRNAHLWELQ